MEQVQVLHGIAPGLARGSDCGTSGRGRLWDSFQWRGAQRYVDVLDLAEFVQLLQALLAARAREFVAAKGGAGYVDGAVVDPDIAGLRTRRGTVGRDQVLGPERGR